VNQVAHPFGIGGAARSTRDSPYPPGCDDPGRAAQQKSNTMMADRDMKASLKNGFNNRSSHSQAPTCSEIAKNIVDVNVSGPVMLIYKTN
jgi:hypothetical protein